MRPRQYPWTARLHLRRAVLFLGYALCTTGLLLGCGSRPAKLYEGEYRAKGEVAVIRSDEHTILVSVDGTPVREHVSIDTKQELIRRSSGNSGEPFEVTPGAHKFEVGFVGWERVPDTLIVLDIGGTTYTYSRQSKKNNRVRYYRSNNKRTITLTVEAGKSYLLESVVRNLDLPPLPEDYLRTDPDQLEGLRKAREAELQLDFPLTLELDWDLRATESTDK